MVQILIKHGADVNAGMYKGGLTPLANAVVSGSVEIVDILIQHGADVNVNIKVIGGTSILDWAVLYTRLTSKVVAPKEVQQAKDYPKIIELLKKAGAKEGKR